MRSYISTFFARNFVLLCLFLVGILCTVCCSEIDRDANRNTREINIPDAPFDKLSDYGFFIGEQLAALKPAARLLPYELNSALFSDYTSKLRFVWMPQGSAAKWTDEEVFDFPEGAVLIKNFFYKSELTRNIIETRLLIKRENKWESLPYIWNETQTEAYLKLAGGKAKIDLAKYVGNPHSTKASFEFDYIVPNKNQCKGCHSVSGDLKPIGPKARNLNKLINYGFGDESQLDKWINMGYLSEAPESDYRPSIEDYNNENALLHDRALAYLEINCGHCHRSEGPASTSGLHLITSEKELSKLGFCKTPVAAGKGSGGLSYDIHPGKPDSSILLYRMKIQDPGIRMPEVGRQVLHQEGVDLISEWISALEYPCN
ncbi:MAG: putative repeat protein (TIGR03806 family) [Limisphaerales bacterium]|jgi:uncharacterized repeat protein (TIGR03806 family)